MKHHFLQRELVRKELGSCLAGSQTIMSVSCLSNRREHRQSPRRIREARERRPNIARWDYGFFVLSPLALSMLFFAHHVQGFVFLAHVFPSNRAINRSPRQISPHSISISNTENDATIWRTQSSTTSVHCQKEPSHVDQEHRHVDGHASNPSLQAAADGLMLSEVDVLYDRSSELLYDPVLDRYRKATSADYADVLSSVNSPPRHGMGRMIWNTIAPRLSVAFLPAGVTPNYYRFMRWRVLQRFVNANLHVFGTQSLLMGLGIKSSSSQLGALSAALKWVLKDALGKIVRMTWASRMGRRFDSDAKRWRFRSAYVYAMGNFLEITTYIIPNMFLVWATLANCCKQVSMLTSSSTRTSIYNSFRDGSRENIGDITAKGEAQIAVVDLLGIASGVSLSRLVGTSAQSIVLVYAMLQAFEIVCMYRQLRTVVYRVLNFERMSEVIDEFLDSTTQTTLQSSHVDLHEHQNADLSRVHVVNGTPAQSEEQYAIHGSKERFYVPSAIKTPDEMARTERIFLPPKRLARRANAFGSLGRTKLSPAELERLLQIFAKERFLLVVGQNIKHGTTTRIRQRRLSKEEVLKENCHIVLHKDATNSDIVKASLALLLLRRKLVAASSELDPSTVRSSDCFHMVEESLKQTEDLYGLFRRHLSKQGWESPARFMFGRVHMRAEWPLAKTTKTRVSSSNLQS